MTPAGQAQPLVDLVPAELRDRLARLGRRDWVFAQVEAWLRSPDRFFLLTGGPGTGKTMLAAQILAGAGAPDGWNEWTAAHFCSTRLSGYSRHPRQLISNLQHRLASRFPKAYLSLEERAAQPLIQLTGSVTADSVAGAATGVNLTIGTLTAAPRSIGDFFQIAVIEPLTRLADTSPGATVGIVIDGLDEAAALDGPNIVTLLHEYSASLPRICKVLVTSQNVPAVLDPLLAAVSDTVRLDLSSPRNRAAVNDDVLRFVRQAAAHAGTGDSDLPERITRTVAGSFLHASGLVREAVGGGIPSTGAQDLGAYYHEIFDRMRHAVESSGPGRWAACCQPLLRHLAVARAPRGFDSVLAFFGWDAATLFGSLEGVRPVILVEDDLRTVSLEHQAVSTFLLSEVTGGSRPNPYGTAESTVQATLVDRVTALIGTAWAGRWTSADEYFLEHTAAHLHRLQALDPAAARGLVGRLRLVDLAAAIAAPPVGLTDAQAAMATLLRVAASGAGESYEPAVERAACSPDPFLRSAVLDSLQDDVPGPRAAKLVMRLLCAPDIRRQTVGISAMTRLPQEDRNRTVRWIATDAPPELRRYAAYALYLLAGQKAGLAARTLLDPVVDTVSLLHPRRTKRAVEFLSTVSITAYTNYCDNPEVALETSALWRRITVERLRINLLNRPILQAPIVSVTARQLAGRIVDNAVIRSEMPPLPSADRAIVRALLPGLTPGSDLAALAGPLASGFEAGSWTARTISGCVAMVHAISDPVGARPVLDRIFHSGSGMGRIWQISAHSVLIRATPPAWVKGLQDMERRVRQENAADLETYLTAGGLDLDLFSIATPLAFAKHGVPMAERFRSLVAETDPPGRRALFTGLAAVGLYYPAPTLAAAHHILQTLGSPDVGELVAGMLARIRVMHPAMVDLLVRDLHLLLPPEPVGESAVDFAWRHVDALGLYNNAVHQAIHYPRMRDRLLCPGFAGLADAADAKAFVKDYVPRVLALLRETDYELTEWMR